MDQLLEFMEEEDPVLYCWVGGAEVRFFKEDQGDAEAGTSGGGNWRLGRMTGVWWVRRKGRW